MDVRNERIEGLIRQLLTELGEDPQREGLARTPRRVATSLAFLTSGYNVDIEALINGARFTQETTSMVILRNIEFYSLCEHHMLPFFGRCHIGYLPGGRVFGVSKLARLVEVFARRLQLQERLTEQISHAIMDAIDPVGVGVLIEAQHLCMMMRGIQKQQAVMTTSSLLGSFRENATTRQEFLTLINRREP
ncbi:MAG: GTP cyclohydrolase I FolE [Dehalococcoidia bacterium]|jgi:GTP cyclohydrolase I